MSNLVNRVAIVAGAGAFGKKIGDYFLQEDIIPVYFDIDRRVLENVMPAVETTVDGMVETLATIAARHGVFVYGDAARCLPVLLELDIDIAFIAPAAPVHLMAMAWRELLKLAGASWVKNPVHVTSIHECVQKVGPYHARLMPDDGIAIFSAAPDDAICPPACTGIIETCLHSKNREPLFSVFSRCASSLAGVHSWIFESRQLAPGIGAIPWKEVVSGVKRFRSMLGTLQDTLELVIGTACACHGVINGFTIARGSRDPFI